MRAICAALLIALGGHGSFFPTPDSHTRVSLEPADTLDATVREDLRIIDTISSSSPLAEIDPRPPAVVFGHDTLVVVNVYVFPPFPRSDTELPGQPNVRGMRVDVNVSARDTSSRLHELELPYADCPLTLQVKRLNGRRNSVAWRSVAARYGLSCPHREVHGRGAFGTMWAVQDILGDSLPAGFYSLEVVVRFTTGKIIRTEKDSVYLTTDPTPPNLDLSVFEFQPSLAVKDVGPRVMEASVVARNISTRLAELDFGDCSLHVQLFDMKRRDTIPVWNSDYRAPRERPNVAHAGYGCPAVLRHQTLAPGETHEFIERIPVAEILADSLAFGTYRARIFLSLENNRERRLQLRGGRTFDLGPVTIMAKPDSFPRSRTINRLRYTAGARLIRGRTPGEDTVLAVVLITNASDRLRAQLISQECPVTLAAYRATADRDSLPLRAPAWQASTGRCYLRLVQASLRPRQRFALAVKKAVGELPETDREGRFYLLTWLAGAEQVMVNAGKIDLRR
ncbi:MAG TPA: hypothetical protein VJ840_16150 [Gemmatimonadaceae bacterium]|nr:hypothetical protein [Gemmatimonadaceae bacterium]